jgi:hypothetical protein
MLCCLALVTANVTANVFLSSPILVILMMVALLSSETLVFTRATRSNIPEDGILHSHAVKISDLTRNNLLINQDEQKVNIVTWCFEDAKITSEFKGRKHIEDVL